NLCLETGAVTGQGQVFERLMRLMKDDRGRCFVDLARLNPDYAIFDVVDATNAVGAGELVQSLDERDGAHLRAVERDRYTPFERDRHVGRLVWRRRRI